MATILILDDHPNNRSFLLTLLASAGYQLLESANGAGQAELGLTRERMEGRTLWEALSPEMCAQQEPYYRPALMTI